MSILKGKASAKGGLPRPKAAFVFLDMSQFKPRTTSQGILDGRQMVDRPRPMLNLSTDSAGVVLAEKPSAAAVRSSEAIGEATGVAEDVAVGGAEKAALVLTLLFVFFRFSFLHELITTKFGIDLHLLMLVGGLSVLAALFSGSLFVGIFNQISIAWLAFATCMLAATLFSIWKGGSFAVWYPYLRTTLILVVLIPAAAQSSKSIVQVLKMIGIAGLVTIILGLTVSDFRTGRLELSAAASVSNSNDYAAIVILVMPAIAFLTLRKGTNFVMKIVGCAALGICCFLVLSTGSRGALVSMGLTTLYLLKIGSGAIRAAILVGLPILVLAAIPFLPGEASVRLAAMFSSTHATDEATESQEQRTALLMESLRATMQHPMLGVGPGTFQEYQAQMAGESGQRGMWHETHNAYTQVSSECGIPAFVCYMSAIFMTLFVFGRGRKSADPNLRAASSVLALMLVSFSFCMFFLAQAYGFGFPVLGGIAISIDRLLKREEGQLVENMSV